MTDNIKLPPMPEWAKMDNLNGMVPSEIRTALNEFGREAVRLNATVPDGWALVPLEPTLEMLEAGTYKIGVRDCYRAMLSAAPAALQPAQQRLTDEQAASLAKQLGWDTMPERFPLIVRAVEQAHGIGVKP